MFVLSIVRSLISLFYVNRERNGNGNGIYIPHFLYDIFKCGLHEQG